MDVSKTIETKNGARHHFSFSEQWSDIFNSIRGKYKCGWYDFTFIYLNVEVGSYKGRYREATICILGFYFEYQCVPKGFIPAEMENKEVASAE